MRKITISGYSASEGTRTFEILDRPKIEEIIDNLSTVDIYERTYREAAGYTHSGSAYTYVNAMTGELKTYWLSNNTIEHPWSSFNQIIVCSVKSGNGSTDFDSGDMLDDEEQKEFREFNGSLEEFITKTDTDFDERLQNCIDHESVEFEMDWDDIERQLDDLYGKAEIDEELFEQYKEWRKVSEEMLSDGFKGSIDCGESSVREDFSAYTKLPKVIGFKEMFAMEKAY